MALKYYKNKETQEIKRSLKKLDLSIWEELLVAPNQKFMVAANPEKGSSKLKDSQKILTERARNHSREVELDDNVQVNRANGLSAKVDLNLLNEKRERRRKVDDL